MLGATDGQLGPDVPEGFFLHGRRVLSLLRVLIDDRALSASVVEPDGPSAVTFSGAVDLVESIRWYRKRSLTGRGLTERLGLRNDGGAAVMVRVCVELAADLARLDLVKIGADDLDRRALDPDQARDGALVAWRTTGMTMRLTADRAPTRRSGSRPGTVVLFWDVTLTDDWELELRWTADTAGARLRHAEPRQGQALVSDSALVRTSLAQVDALTALDGDHIVATAGSPWYLALFGRDAIWTARLLLHRRPALALDTLHALAARQALGPDPTSGALLGKIPHEIRPEAVALDGGAELRPVSYMAADTTALWICLLHDAWRAGAARGDIHDLLPALWRALVALVGECERHPLGLAAYSTNGPGLVHQAWKDSPDAMRGLPDAMRGLFDGEPEMLPDLVATCELQGYAHEAATGAAAVLDVLDEPGSAELLSWAETLRNRFRRLFWQENQHGRHPAFACDSAGRLTQFAASNMAHVLGTGLVNSAEADAITDRLAETDLSSAYGLRTLAAGAASFDAHSYHRGSVWPHDNAVAVLGLAREGRHDDAGRLGNQLMRAIAELSGRVPELYAVSDGPGGRPAVVPGACDPQAWSSAGAVLVADYLDGNHPLSP